MWLRSLRQPATAPGLISPRPITSEPTETKPTIKPDTATELLEAEAVQKVLEARAAVIDR